MRTTGRRRGQTPRSSGPTTVARARKAGPRARPAYSPPGRRRGRPIPPAARAAPSEPSFPLCPPAENPPHEQAYGRADRSDPGEPLRLPEREELGLRSADFDHPHGLGGGSRTRGLLHRHFRDRDEPFAVYPHRVAKVRVKETAGAAAAAKPMG